MSTSQRLSLAVICTFLEHLIHRPIVDTSLLVHTQSVGFSLSEPRKRERVWCLWHKGGGTGGFSPPQFLTFACRHFVRIIGSFAASHTSPPIIFLFRCHCSGILHWCWCCTVSNSVEEKEVIEVTLKLLPAALTQLCGNYWSQKAGRSPAGVIVWLHNSSVCLTCNSTSSTVWLVLIVSDTRCAILN